MYYIIITINTVIAVSAVLVCVRVQVNMLVCAGVFLFYFFPTRLSL